MFKASGSLLRAGFVAMTAAALSGCGQSPSATEAMNANPSLLELENGGLTTADERPEFSDPGFSSLSELQPVGSDNVLTATGELQADPNPPGRRLFEVLVLWGNLPQPHDEADAPTERVPATATDWSGSIQVDRGHLSVGRTVGFEDRDVVAPRADPARVDFTSHTQPFVDGMLLRVRSVGDPGSIHLRTAAFNGDLDLTGADGGVGVRRLADGQNGVFYLAQEVQPGCAHGVVFGRWARARAHFGGFRGRVFQSGEQVGVVRGLWGHRRDGQGVYFGKYINEAGAWRGLFGGQYGDGRFEGVWGTRDPANRGVLVGRYFDGHERNDGRGLFVGRWREVCR